ncbi:efflux RND transporter permease subunit [Thiospirochaeta perfilievii]|uniref:Efflux RND transporter permease subunit n=1 Tax=Thiospirochaeta perfilievii TaxID=252967 RepID=A0A5C1Q784_9SPIO|nr:efflux RND transporter permease subunit [Thiospirochaeta perfilievii]QEN03875.1 efflux RND transporter permease subunit [Thiospirochaeta perfilievii]
MSIGKFSVRNPVLINIAIVTILVLGFLSLNKLPREQFSEVPFFWVNVIVPYPGVSAEDIEKSVTIPVENELKSIDKLKTIQSVSSEGLSVVRVEFDDGISNSDFESLFQDVRTRFSKVLLPDGTLPALIDDFSSSDFLPVIEVIISGDSSYDVLANEATLLENRIKSVPEVSGVDIIGLREKQVVIEANRLKLNSLGISINEIVRAVSLQNVNVPGGTLETESRDYLLRTVGELDNIENFNRVIVRRGESNSSVVKVSDIATVLDTYDPKGIISRFNGETSIALRVSKIPRGNSVGVIEGVKKEIEDLEKKLPVGLKITLSGDSTIQIKDSINVLLNNAIFGLILLVIILLFFVGFRNAMITALGIPVTFAITFVVLEYFGETFNTNTLFGMVLVLGLIVDHAIVITENSFRLQHGGLSRKEAAIQGVNQVVIPVIAATGTTVAAFLPLMILPGTIGKFLRVIPFTVSIALIASTFEAIVFIPSHYADWPHGKKESVVFQRFTRFQNGFKSLIKSVYSKKKIVLPMLFLVVVAAFSLVPLLNQDLFSAEDFTLFYIDIEMSPGTPISKTNDITKEFEKKILPLVGNGEIVSVISSVGFSSGSSGNTSRSNVSQIVVDLSERTQGRTRSITDIMNEVQWETINIPGAENVKFSKATNGPPTSKPISFRLFGENYDNLISASNSIIGRLSNYSDLYNIENNLEKGSPELRVKLNEDRASALGLDVLTLGSFLRDSVEGRTATTFFKDNKEVEVIVRYNNDEELSLTYIDELMIPLPDGRLIPFSSVANIVQGNALGGIKRVDGKREVTIESEAYSNDSVKDINRDIKSYFQEELQNRYPEIELVVGGEFADLGNLLFQILRVFLIGLFLIYLILGAQFKSYIQPFLIILTIPFAFAGVILYLFISKTPFSTTVLYSGVALAGIAVNDSIVLLSFINELREKGYSVRDAIIESAETRLRPILLTSLTTIAGLLPTAIGIGGKSVVWSPMAGSIIFGLIFSTLTALIVIPLVYGALFDKEGKK